MPVILSGQDGIFEGVIMKTLSLKLPELLFAKLASAAEKRGESKSALVREAIEAFLSEDSPVPESSCLDLAKDLAGCVNGPVDLSLSKKHMFGYGQ